MRWSALRYFNAAGADPEGGLGECHDPEIHLIPVALEAAAGLRAKLSLYGTDYPTPDGSCVRDYVHVSDLGDAPRARLSESLRKRISPLVEQPMDVSEHDRQARIGADIEHRRYVPAI